MGPNWHERLLSVSAPARSSVACDFCESRPAHVDMGTRSAHSWETLVLPHGPSAPQV